MDCGERIGENPRGSPAGSAGLPPAPNLPQFALTLAYLTAGRGLMQYLARRLGPAFTINLPVFGPAVIVSERDLIKDVFAMPSEAVRGVEPNLSAVTGPGSMFGLQGSDHLHRRKLLTPPFHGRRMRAYEGLVEDEFRREAACWPQGREFPVLPSMMRITLNTILRSVFGAEGAELRTLQALMPRMVTAGSRLAMLPWLHHDIGPWSPWGRFLAMRREFDHTVDTLISRAVHDPDFEHRADVLSLMLRARSDDGDTMSHGAIKDELVGLVGAGHETTAITLAWAVERLRRHPDLLARLVDQVDAGESALLSAVVHETHRTRPTIDAAARHVVAPSVRLGPWVIPRGYTLVVNIGLSHRNESHFTEAAAFHPDRFLGTSPDYYSWVPFGGGVRRCPGAAFANMEVVVVLRTLLREFRLVPTTARGERTRSRGVAFAPARGGRAVVHRRPPIPAAVVPARP